MLDGPTYSQVRPGRRDGASPAPPRVLPEAAEWLPKSARSWACSLLGWAADENLAKVMCYGLWIKAKPEGGKGGSCGDGGEGGGEGEREEGCSEPGTAVVVVSA